VTPTVPITTTPPPENTLALLTIQTVQLRTAIPQPDIGLPHDCVEAYQEEQQVQACARQADAEPWQCIGKVNSSANKRPLRPNCPNCTTASQPHQRPSPGQGCHPLHKPRGATTPHLREGQPKRGYDGCTSGHFACTLHRWGGQGIPSTETHSRCHRCIASGELPSALG
jgi:hypothetical protein